MLTRTEEIIYKLNGAGLQLKEIAEFLKKPLSTIQTHWKNLKPKKGVHKDKELTGLCICEFLGVDYEDVKKQIIASCLFFVFVFFGIPQDFDKQRTRQYKNNYRIEATRRKS